MGKTEAIDSSGKGEILTPLIRTTTTNYKGYFFAAGSALVVGSLLGIGGLFFAHAFTGFDLFGMGAVNHTISLIVGSSLIGSGLLVVLGIGGRAVVVKVKKLRVQSEEPRLQRQAVEPEIKQEESEQERLERSAEEVESRKHALLAQHVPNPAKNLILGPTQIVSALENPTPSDENSRLSRHQPCHQILNGLYLGSDTAFIGASHLAIRDGKRKSEEFVTSDNPNQFQTVITLCPLEAIEHPDSYPDLEGLSEEKIRCSFKDHSIDWHYIGVAVSDQSGSWEDLVRVCTWPDSASAAPLGWVRSGIAPEQSRQVQYAERERFKKEEAEATKWFEPMFRLIDEAVKGEKRVLVHCQAGQSRSATLLVAYFINRYEVSTEEAIAFLQSRRPCVDPYKFDRGLKEYEDKLKFQVE